MNILLDYFFPITTIEPTAQASTSFLKQACVVCLPKSGQTPGLYLCTSQTQIAVRTDNLEAQQILNAGLSKVYILIVATLPGVAALIAGHENDFFSMIITSDFNDAAVLTLDVGVYKGVVGISTTTDAFAQSQGTIANRVAFHTTTANKAKNMLWAFGKMLSNLSNWRNQQYITMPFVDDVNTLGLANTLFDQKTSFVIDDTEYGARLGLFAAGGKAIVSPYIKRNLEIDMQSRALTYISGNQPQYTKKQAALLEDELKKVIESYIEREWIEDGTVEIKLINSNFIATGNINISEPKALWRIFAEMRQTL